MVKLQISYEDENEINDLQKAFQILEELKEKKVNIKGPKKNGKYYKLYIDIK